MSAPTEQGFYEMTHEEYHSQCEMPVPAFSYSIAKRILESPRHAHYFHPRLGKGEKESSDAMGFGQIVHKLLLGHGKDIVIGEFEDFRKNDAKAWRDEVLSQGHMPILAKKYEPIQAMVETVEAQIREFCPGFYDSNVNGVETMSEAALIWYRGKTETNPGVLCQSMFDRVVGGQHIYDIKTIADTSQRKIERAIIDNGYDLQNAFYVEALGAMYPELAGRISFTFLFVGSQAPHCVVPVQLSGQWFILGTERIERAAKLWVNGLKHNYWPGPPSLTGEKQLAPPAWVEAQEIMNAYEMEDQDDDETAA